MLIADEQALAERRRRLFHRAAGHVSSLVEEAARAGNRWFQGDDDCQQAFA